MEKKKTTSIGQDINRKPQVQHHILGVFAVVKREDGEEKEVDLRKIVGSKGKKENK